MFRFVVAVLLINSYSGSWGAPTQNSTILSMSLSLLANSCQNPFLSTQMKNKINDCHVPVPPYHEKQFECLLFYDINRQLCEAVDSSKFTLSEDYTPKILEKQDVSELCSAAKDWVFTDMGEVYKKTVKIVFHDPVKCSKVCSVESDDILSVDSTFYCKYFKWGSDMLKSQVSSRTANALVPAQGQNDIVANTSKTVDIPATNIKIENKTETSFTNLNAPTPKQSNDHETKSTVERTVASNVVKPETVAQLSSINKADEIAPSTVEKQEAVEKDKNTEAQAVIPQAETISTNDAQQQVTQKENVQKNETMSIESKTVVENSKKEATLNNEKKDSASPDLLNQLENPKPKDVADPDDYPGNDIDSDERDGLTDTQGGDDMDDPSLADLETKLDQDLNKKPVKNSELPVYNNDISPKEIYPNTIPDGFAEDDDHFFPFFLTAIIMVVLLYVLYHNKNKVSKVFLGLIVEGRQPGRRRNSRGHAYRRLDTLEQAMSANTAAPPSKIIY